jgi:hypothetical protein
MPLRAARGISWGPSAGTPMTGDLVFAEAFPSGCGLGGCAPSSVGTGTLTFRVRVGRSCASVGARFECFRSSLDTSSVTHSGTN